MFVIGCWLLVSNSILAQNLVPNPSFETYTTCPQNATNNIPSATPWTGPLINNTDYYNACIAPPTYGSIPFHGVYPHSGNAMAGLWEAFNCAPYYREYLQAPLASALLPNNCYYVEFYIIPDTETRTFANNMAMHFSDTNYVTNSTLQCGASNMVLYLKSHILKFGNPVIINTTWTKISGIYKAIGGENHIILGNFQDDYNTDSIRWGGSPYPATYYLVDDVSVIPTDSISMPPYAGKDTTIAFGDSVFIGQQLYGLHCNWYSNSMLLDTNISGIWVKPNVTTTYIVEQTLCGNVGYDTVVVTVSPLGINELKNGVMKIYPNPANDKLFIEQTGNENITEISLFDIYGKKVITENKQNELDISSLTEGIYFLQVKTKEHFFTQKIIVQH